MKKIYLLFAICISTLSCTKDEEPAEKAFVPDPTIISEYHELNNDGNIRYKYSFDNNGRILAFIDFLNDQTKYTYNFDLNNRLINISKYNSDGDVLESTDIIYNSDGKVLGIGDNSYSYNPNMADFLSIDGFIFPEATSNFYVLDNSYQEFVGEDDTEITFYYYIEDLDGNITKKCQYEIYSYHESEEIPSGSCWYGNATNWNYSNDLLLSIVPADRGNYFGYDSTTNPLFQGTTNLSFIAPFFDYYYLKYYFNNNLMSINNVNIEETEREDPYHHEYVYEFNELNLPISRTRQNYYHGDKEGELIDAKYYYQTDVIP